MIVSCTKSHMTTLLLITVERKVKEPSYAMSTYKEGHTVLSLPVINFDLTGQQLVRLDFSKIKTICMLKSFPGITLKS